MIGAENFGLPILVFLLAHGVISAVVFTILIKLLENSGHTRTNYLGNQIPASVGIGFVLLAFPVFFIQVIDKKIFSQYFNQFLLITLGFGFFGVLDDFLIEREKGGLTGHLKRFLRTGIVSTALLKAFFGLALCAVVFQPGSKGYGWILNVLIVALSANAINLLDVKAGRALKGFWLYALAVIGLVFWRSRGAAGCPISHSAVLPVVAVLVSSIVYSRWDFGRKAMMGDVGSNVLGAVAGLGVAWGLPVVAKWWILGGLVLFHVVGEFWSFSRLFESVGVLKWIDGLGVGAGGVKAPEGGDSHKKANS